MNEMKTGFKTVLRFTLFAVFVSAAVSLRAADGGEVLWWLVEDLDKIVTQTADGKTVSAEDLGVNAARIRYDTGTESGYLPIYAVSGDNQVFPATGTGQAALLPGEYFSALGGFTGASYSFVIELGNWSDGSWVRTSMESVAANYDNLKTDRCIAEWQDTVPVYSSPWTPGSYSAVPEPTSGLLLCIGTALLLLRRRPNASA